MTFAELIRERRKAREWRVKDLAEFAGLSSSYISLVEFGKKNPRIYNAVKIANALDIDIGELKDIDERFKVWGACDHAAKKAGRVISNKKRPRGRKKVLSPSA